jgi:dTDP-4-amino-4,6-dideoxygalactose transaminase
VDIGSSFLPSDITAAFLFAQLESLNDIQHKRKQLWEHYLTLLKPLEEQGIIKLPLIPSYATNNGHLFYILSKNLNERQELISYLKQHNIYAVFHYLSLHKSEFYKKEYKGDALPMSDQYSDTLLRLPLFYELTVDDIERICMTIYNFYKIQYPF